MRRKWSMILIGLLLITLLCSCGQDEDQKKCLSSLKEGLQARWDLNQDMSPNGYLESAQVELDALEEYKDFTFEDEEFGEIIGLYIEALESQVTGAQYMLTDANEFETLYYKNGYDIRSKCLKKLCDKYSFKVDDKYSDDLQSILDGDRPEVLRAGKIVEAKSDYGDINISIDSAKITNWNTMDDEIETGYNAILVNCSVENLSYSDPYNGNYVSAEAFMYVTDNSGNSIAPYSSSYDGSGYKPAAGGFWELPKGRKSKTAIPYILPNDTTCIHVGVMGKDDKVYQIDLKLQ